MFAFLFASLLPFVPTPEPPLARPLFSVEINVFQPKPLPPPVVFTLPQEIKINRGIVVIRPLTFDGDDIAWNIIDAGIDPLPPELSLPPGVFAVQTFDPGRYRVQAVAVKLVDGKPRFSAFQTCTIIVGNPTPPVPPVPPAPPEPTDALYPKLKAAYVKDGKDRQSLATLSALFKLLPDVCNDEVNKNVGMLYQKIQAARKQAIKEALPAVRQVIGIEENATLPVASAQVLDSSTRAAYAAFYMRCATLLDALVKSQEE